MQKDHKHLLVIEVEVEVDLVKFYEIWVWSEKIHMPLFLKHNITNFCLFWCKRERNEFTCVGGQLELTYAEIRVIFKSFWWEWAKWKERRPIFMKI